MPTLAQGTDTGLAPCCHACSSLTPTYSECPGEEGKLIPEMHSS